VKYSSPASAWLKKNLKPSTPSAATTSLMGQIAYGNGALGSSPQCALAGVAASVSAASSTAGLT